MNLCDIPAAYVRVDILSADRLKYTVKCQGYRECSICLTQYGLYRACPQCGGEIPGKGSRTVDCECGARVLICSTSANEVYAVTEFTVDSPVADLVKIEEDII